MTIAPERARAGGAPLAPSARPGPSIRPASPAPSPKPRRWARPVVLLLVLAGLVAASLLVGAYDVLGAPDGARMLLLTRIPRTASLVLAGSALAASGLVMQLLIRNRFVEPTTTGTTEWAGLGLLIALVVFPGSPIVVKMSLAIVFSFGGTMLFFAILSRIRDTSSLVVPIIGIMLGAVVGAASTWLALATNALQSMGAWFMGSFASAIEGQYEPVWAILLVLAGIALVADRLTIAGLGKDVATSVGVDHGRVVLLGTAMVAMVTGIVTVVIGNLPFLGLIVPNIVSLIRGDDLRANLPWVLLVGAGTVTACDIVGRLVVMPFEIPVGTILVVAWCQGIATVAFQTITANRILTPSIMGFESLYRLVQTSVVFAFGAAGISWIPGSVEYLLQAGLMVAFAALLFGSLLGRGLADLHRTLLVGIVLGTGLGAGAAYMQRLLTPTQFDLLSARLIGSIANADLARLGLATPLGLVAGLALIAQSRSLDVLALGPQVAIGLGVDARRTRIRALLLVAVLMAVSTSLVGPMPFLGFLVAMATYEFAGTHAHSRLLPLSALVGVVVLGGAYFVLKHVLYAQGSVGVLIEAVGGTAFLLHILRKGRL